MQAGPNPTHDQTAASAGGAPAAELRPAWRRITLLGLVAAVLLLLVYASPLRRYPLHEVSEQIRGLGGLAPIVVMSGVALLVALGFPRLVFCVLAGMALGFWRGLFWAQLGTLLGNYVLFSLARAWGRDWAQRLVANRTRLHGLLQRRGVLGVVLARQIPLPGLIINLACALLPIRHVDFFFGTLVGQLPQAIPWTLIGAGALQASFGRSIGLIGLAVIVSILGWICLNYSLRRSSSPPPADPLSH